MFDSRQKKEILLFSTGFWRILGTTQSPIRRIPTDPSPEVKRPGPETDHSFLSTRRLRICGAILHSPIRLHGLVVSYACNFYRNADEVIHGFKNPENMKHTAAVINSCWWWSVLFVLFRKLDERRESNDKMDLLCAYVKRFISFEQSALQHVTEGRCEGRSPFTSSHSY
jgi:hypothetical protein